MRSIFSRKPQFLFNDSKKHPVAQKFYDKYNKIDTILDENISIIKEIHQELVSSMNVFKGRESPYSTETLFRMLLVKCIGQLSFRDQRLDYPSQ